MSLYGDAIAAMRRVVLIDERVIRATDQLRDVSAEVQSLRDRVSRLEGMITGLTARETAGPPSAQRRKLPRSDNT
ncbi:hypothetical protein [Acidiphilium iwatense]|uniref:Uncharacterized protein n=1 Tax=Acidiphilium iwatense TaxID=768198 RepID=A0ABS9E2L6_9PROT|nr:hypothetical protein [Acidiphilium iwatense]MCF3948176.1 hypothetical protein [Acidiphilium iwatense]